MSKERRNEAARRMSAATKDAGGRGYVSSVVSREDFEARLAEIPPDTRTLTQRICGDPIPNDQRRHWRTA